MRSPHLGQRCGRSGDNSFRNRSKRDRLCERAISASHDLQRGGATGIAAAYRVTTAVMYPHASHRTYDIGGTSDFAVIVVRLLPHLGQGGGGAGGRVGGIYRVYEARTAGMIQQRLKKPLARTSDTTDE